QVFLSAYGDFYNLLCERGYSHRFAFCLTECAVFDDNCFTKAATKGEAKKLPADLKKAVLRDCRAIIEASLLSSEDIISDYLYKDEIKEIIPTLPLWQRGKMHSAFENLEDSLKSLIDFHKENGCGMFARYKAFIWRKGGITPVLHHDKVSLLDLSGYEYQRQQVIDNTEAFIAGKSCNNVLLYGDKGTGKSTTVKAIANDYRKKGLRIIEMPKERLMDFPLLVDILSSIPLKFIIFIDDLSFLTQDSSYASLKAVLEGGLSAKPDNAVIYATSNRRHLIKEALSDRDTDDVNRRDNMQESLSLSDRFGLSISYTAPSKEEYLSIVKYLAHNNNIEITDQLLSNAESFALFRGGRSPRTAKQFIESLFC
ncbi:MAG: ATP-binding protein, partial [Acutalibacteraceae bacterium]